MNKIMNEIRNELRGQYCHAIEVSDVSDLEHIAESIYEEYNEKYGVGEVINFLATLAVYYLPENEEGPENEERVYNFSFREFVLEYLEG